MSTTGLECCGCWGGAHVAPLIKVRGQIDFSTPSVAPSRMLAVRDCIHAIPNDVWGCATRPGSTTVCRACGDDHQAGRDQRGDAKDGRAAYLRIRTVEARS